jgi:hypothetical protein
LDHHADNLSAREQVQLISVSKEARERFAGVHRAQALKRLQQLAGNEWGVREPELRTHTEALEDLARRKLRRDVQPWADLLLEASASSKEPSLDIWALSLVAVVGYMGCRTNQQARPNKDEVLASFDELWPYLAGVWRHFWPSLRQTCQEERKDLLDLLDVKGLPWIVRRVHRLMAAIDDVRAAMGGRVGQALFDPRVKPEWCEEDEELAVPFMPRYRDMYNPRAWIDSEVWLLGTTGPLASDEVREEHERVQREAKFPELAALVNPKPPLRVQAAAALYDLDVTNVVVSPAAIAPLWHMAAWFLTMTFMLAPQGLNQAQTQARRPKEDDPMTVEDATGYLAGMPAEAVPPGMQSARSAWIDLIQCRAAARAAREEVLRAERRLHVSLGRSYEPDCNY